MSTAIAVQRQIADAQGKLVMLLGEVRNTPIGERVNLWVAKFAKGRKLSEYLGDGAIDPKSRLEVARSLVDILLRQTYDRLPELPAAEIAPAIVAKMAITPPAVQPVAQSIDEPGEDQADDAPAFTPAQQLAIRAEVRRQLGAVFGTMGKVLAE